MSIALIHASFKLAAPVIAGGQLSNVIQWMPPGNHTIKAGQDGKPVEKSVIVNEATAQTMQKTLAEYLAKAGQGEGDIPYFDFNHDDIEASARPKRFFWGGDDKKTGGVQVEVEWTEPGEQKLLGKAFRRFSPSFFLNAAGEVTGAPLNMGGLVNRAAFKTITPIVASDAGDGKNTMDAAELKAALDKSNRELEELKAKLLTMQNNDLVKAKDLEITGLKAQIKEQKDQMAIQAKANGEAVVAAAVKAGKLPPQNKEIQAKWVEAITANPALAETLNSMPVNAALATVTNPGSGGAADQPGASDEHAFLVKAKELAKSEKVDLGDAVIVMAGKEPALYEDYRSKLEPKK